MTGAIARLVRWALVSVVLVCALVGPRPVLAQDDDLGLGEEEAPGDEALGGELDALDEGSDDVEDASSDDLAAEGEAAALDDVEQEAPVDPVEREEPGEPTATREAAVLSVDVGVGVGSLGLSRPTVFGRQELPQSTFAAVTVETAMHLASGEAVSYDLRVRYASSVGFLARFEPLFGLTTEVDARAQRAELLFEPRFRFSDTPGAVALSVPVGITLRSFVPKEQQYGLPNQLLVGPELGLLLTLPLGELARLRLGPEVVWIVYVEDELRDQGTGSTGVSVGGLGTLEANLGDVMRAGVVFRAAHTRVSSGSRGYEDTESLLTVVLGARFR